MSLRSDVRAALQARLDTVTGIPDADHQLDEDTTSDAPIGDVFLEKHLGFAELTRLTLPARGARMQKDGTWRLLLHWPLGTGTDAPDTLAQAVADAFPSGLTVSSGATTVRIDSAKDWGGSPGIRDNYYTVPIDIRWHVWTTNTLT